MTILVSISYGTEWSICTIDNCDCDVNIVILEEFTADENMFLLGIVRVDRYQLEFVGYYVGDFGVLDFYGEVLGKEVVICNVESELIGRQLCFNLYFEI